MTENGWEDNLGLADDTTKVSIYCNVEDKETWTEEAEKQGRSRSTYLYELIQEARAYRQAGFLGWEESQERIEGLESEVERLEEKVNKEKSVSKTKLRNPEPVTRHLSTKYKTLNDIVQEFVEQKDLETVLRPAIEDTLYVLAERDVVEYQRGHGWRLTERGDE